MKKISTNFIYLFIFLTICTHVHFRKSLLKKTFRFIEDLHVALEVTAYLDKAFLVHGSSQVFAIVWLLVSLPLDNVQHSSSFN